MVLLIAAVATQGNRFCLIAAFVLFFVALIVHRMAGVSLSVAGYEDGVFGVKGLSKAFPSAAGERSSAETPEL